MDVSGSVANSVGATTKPTTHSPPIHSVNRIRSRTGNSRGKDQVRKLGKNRKNLSAEAASAVIVFSEILIIAAEAAPVAYLQHMKGYS
jgi:hypothetical protein